MFTGLVQHLGRVARIDSNSTGRALIIDASGWSHQPGHGESIAVNGCCLTVADDTASNTELRFDVIHQTLRMTALGALVEGDVVNLEASVTPTTMLGGHIVQGHVDGVGTVTAIDQNDGEYRVRIEPPTELLICIIERGSIAVDGISLTVAGLGDTWFEVALIPTTLAMTTMSQRAVSDHVNIETDYVAKIVARQVEAQLAKVRG